MSDTESALIGSMIIDPSQTDIAQGIVAPSDFADIDLGQVYAVLLDMHGAGDPIGDHFELFVGRELEQVLHAQPDL